MNTVSFVTANFVARQVNFNMTGGWGQGDQATKAYYQPLDTYPERFDELLATIHALGFRYIDLWEGQLGWEWATDEHIAIAQDLLKKYHFTVTSLSGWFGSTPEKFERACRLAKLMETEILGGNTGALAQDRARTVAILKGYSVKLGMENHPEKTPQEVLAKIGDGGGGTLGTALDTGWFATQGYDAARALAELAPHLFLVHLKDVKAVGTHETCRFGEGIVNIKGCLAKLSEIGYNGDIVIEHEPDFFDPSDDIRYGRLMVERWMNGNVER